MKGEWCYYDSYFTPEQCEQIIELGKTLEVIDAQIGSDGSVAFSESRRSKIRWIYKEDHRFNWLFDSIWKMAIQANNQWFGFHLSKLDFIQFTEYSEEYLGEYKIHHDVFYMNNDPTYHRKLSCIIQLSDPATYEGGNFEVHDVHQELPPNTRNRGTAIWIPSFTRHAVTPVTKGMRYSLVSWIDGPKWR